MNRGTAFFSSLQARLLLLVLLAVIPALGLTLYTNLEERQLRKAQVQEHALRLARIVSADHERLIEGARKLLASLARLTPVSDRNRAAGCNELFADLLMRHSSYANLGVIGADGNVFCSGVPMTGQVYVGDRAYFRQARETRDFAVGDYQIGRITGKATLNFGHPVLVNGHLRVVLFAALDLTWLNEFVGRVGLPAGSMLTVIDRHGTILARYPDHAKWVGKPMPESLVLKATAAQQGNGTTEARSEDGILRLFSFAPFGGTASSANAYVSIGIPTDCRLRRCKPDSRPQSCWRWGSSPASRSPRPGSVETCSSCARFSRSSTRPSVSPPGS